MPCFRWKKKCLFQQTLFILTAIFLWLGVLGRCYAVAGDLQQPALPAEAQDDPLNRQDEEQEWIDVVGAKATERLLSSVEWFDNFFDDTRYSEEENKTRGRLKLKSSYTENDRFEFRPSMSLRLHLPKLSERAQLLFFAREDEETDFNDLLSGSNSTEDNMRDDVTAAIRYFVKEAENYNVSFTGGASLNYLYGGLRFRYLKDLGLWNGRFVERLRYYTDEGWENKITADLERQFSEVFVFRITGSLLWLEEQDSWPHTLLFRLYQYLGNNRALSYEWENYFETDPSHKMTDMLLRVRYRQKFYRDWLYFEIAPQVTFPEEYDREADLGIVFAIEGDFGHKISSFRR